MKNWFRDAFSKDYIRIYKHRDSTEAEEFIDYLLSRINLPAGAMCLDLGCGFGRHLAHLNRKNIRTYGVDLSQDLLDFASESTPNVGRLVRADMRRLPFSTNFDFVFSFFSTFGYFVTDLENLEVIKEISRVLKPNGGFLIDYMNSCYVKDSLTAEDHQQFPDFELRQRRRINERTNAVEKELSIKDDEGERVIKESLKLYEAEHFSAFCRDAGLIIKELLGSYDGEAFRDQSKRLIVIGEKR